MSLHWQPLSALRRKKKLFFYLFNSIIRAAFHLKLSPSCACPWVLKQTVDHNQYHLNLHKVASSFFFPELFWQHSAMATIRGMILGFPSASFLRSGGIMSRCFCRRTLWLFFCLPHSVMSLLDGATFGQQDKLHNLITRCLAKRFAFKIS